MDRVVYVIAVILRWLTAFLALSANDRDAILGRTSPKDRS